MNEEKNNIGVNNNGLPPMNTVTTGSISSQNMNSNNLPPMGAMPLDNSQTNNIQNKYGLPPISNFTNFNTSYEPPKIDDNTSVFDLMNQFDSVNSDVGGNNQQVVNNTNSIVNSAQPQELNGIVTPNSNTTSIGNEQMNSVQNVNSIPSGSVVSNQGVSIANNTNNTIPNQEVPVINNVNSIEPLNMFSGNNVNVVQPFSGGEGVPIQSSTNEVSNINNVSATSNPLNIFGGNIDNDQASINSVNTVPSVNTPLDSVQNTVSVPSVNNVDNVSNMSNLSTNVEGNNSVVNNLNPINVPNGGINVNQENINDINMQNQISASNANNKENNTIIPDVNFNGVVQNNGLIDNQEDEGNISSAINIPTMSIDDVINNSNNVNSNNVNNSNSYDDSISELITTFDTSTNTNTNTNTNNSNALYDSEGNVNIDNTSNTTTNNTSTTIEKPKKKKKGKILFIILLIVTILILAAVGVLSYFMFFKTDKLVCGFQDYSNEQYILDESMIIKFKGNKMTDAKLSQVLTFTEDNLDKKDSYLEELKNQYQGLGFNVSFVENEDGFEIDMNFTKSDLESWYGTSLKNSSKTQMKKEMRDSGYTCK